MSDVFKKTQTFRISTVQPKGLNINFSFIRTGILHTSCARYYTRACFDHFMSMILSSTVQRFFLTLKKGHISKTFVVLLETFDTFWYFFTEYHLIICFFRLTFIYWLLTCWLTVEAPRYLLLANHFHILLSSLYRSGQFFAQLLALGSSLLLRNSHSNKNQHTSKIQLFVTNISVRVLKTRRLILSWF